MGRPDGKKRGAERWQPTMPAKVLRKTRRRSARSKAPPSVVQERAKGAEQKAQGAMGREERGTGSRQAEDKGKAAPSSERPTAASDDSKRRRR